MQCPKCKSEQVIVYDSRSSIYTKRKRKCLICGNKWKTIEIPQETYSFMLDIFNKRKGIDWN